jgi:hypothetical protein
LRRRFSYRILIQDKRDCGMHSQRIISDGEVPPLFCHKPRKELREKPSLTEDADNRGRPTSQIHTSNMAADAPYAVSPQLFWTSGLADYFVKR